MKFRLLTNVLVLGLFVTATMLVALVAPAKAGYARMDSEAMANMSPEMPCCPNPKDKQPDCTTNCTALSFCLAIRPSCVCRSSPFGVGSLPPRPSFRYG